MRIFGRNAIVIGNELVAGGFAKDFADVSRKFFGSTRAYLSVQKGRLDYLCGDKVVATLRARVVEVAACSPPPAAAAARKIAALIDHAAKVAEFYH